MLLDLLAVLVYFAVIITVGLWARVKDNESGRDFSLGGRNMPWWAITASVLASELSAATFLGTPDEGFALRNFAYAQLAIGTVLARVIVAYLFLKPYYVYNVMSVYELLGTRYGPITKNMASALFIVTRLLASGSRLFVPAILLVFALEGLQGQGRVGFYTEVSLYAGCIIGLTLLTTIYTAAGGIRSVVWTDLIQASIMIGAVSYTIISLWFQVGGWAGLTGTLHGPHDWAFFQEIAPDVVDLNTQPRPPFLEYIKDVLSSEYTIYAALLGSTFVTMATHGTDQDMVQRMLTAPNYHRSRLALIASGLADIPISLGFLFIGLLLAAFYAQHTEIKTPASHPFAHFILDQMPPGARGLVIAGLLATGMGSLSTALNALATSFAQDFWKPYFSGKPQTEVSTTTLRWCTVAFAALLAAVGTCTAVVVIQNPHARILPVVLGIFGYTYGSLLGVFLVALTTTKRGTELGNVIGMIAGMICVAILSGLPWDLWNIVCGQTSDANPIIHMLIGFNLCQLKDGYIHPPEALWQIEFPWRVMFGAITTYAVAVCFPLPFKNAEGRRTA